MCVEFTASLLLLAFQLNQSHWFLMIIGNMLSVQGMGEFLDEMAMMMSQTKPNVCFKFTHLSSFLI